MTGQELWDLNTSILGGRQMGDTLFFQLVNMAKRSRESKRPWARLRTEDTSMSFSQSDVSEKDLPADFIKTYEYRPGKGKLQLIDSDGNVEQMTQIDFEERHKYATQFGYFYINQGTSKLGITGTPDRAYTAHLFYIAATPSITLTTSWSKFPEDYHPVLAFDVAIINKGGIDWDTVNANQVPYNASTIRDLESSMAMWDAELQQSSLNL